MTEWQSIVEPNARSYGSCVRTQNTTKVKYLKHFVDSSDTLQGIALKHGTSTDELRRINKLFSNDSIFIRDYLLIPSSHPSKVNNIGIDTKTNEQQSITNMVHEENVIKDACIPNKTGMKNSTNNGESGIVDNKSAVIKCVPLSDENDAYSFLRNLDSKIQAGKDAVNQFKTDVTDVSEHCAQTTRYFNPVHNPSTAFTSKYGVSSPHLYEL